jgi:hypothetical protein
MWEIFAELQIAFLITCRPLWQRPVASIVSKCSTNHRANKKSRSNGETAKQRYNMPWIDTQNLVSVDEAAEREKRQVTDFVRRKGETSSMSTRTFLD